MPHPEADPSRHPKILLVGGAPARTDDVARVLARDLGGEAFIVRVTEVPADLAAFDAAVVVRSDAANVLERLAGLPAVLVADEGAAADCASLARMGAHLMLPAACATCTREPNLALSVRWAIEHGHLVR